jgi:hypothetical protein
MNLFLSKARLYHGSLEANLPLRRESRLLHSKLLARTTVPLAVVRPYKSVMVVDLVFRNDSALLA